MNNLISFRQSFWKQLIPDVEKGILRRIPFKARSLDIVETAPPLMDLVAVPIVGTAAGGAPILAVENWIGEILVEARVARGSCFALQVKGDSMIDARIADGDLVIVRRQQVAENGDIIVALLGDEATIKRLYVGDGTPAVESTVTVNANTSQAISDIDYVTQKVNALDGRISTYTIRQVTEEVRRSQGGIMGFARGGHLPGFGGGDRISALLEAGEFVIRKEAVQRYGLGLMESLNRMHLRLPELPRYAIGGLVNHLMIPTLPSRVAFASGGSVSPAVKGVVRLDLTFNINIYFGGSYGASESKHATDLLAEFQQRGYTLPKNIYLSEAKFQIKFTASKAPRTLVIRPANQAMYTRDGDSLILETWMKRRGYDRTPALANEEEYADHASVVGGVGNGAGELGDRCGMAAASA